MLATFAAALTQNRIGRCLRPHSIIANQQAAPGFILGHIAADEDGSSGETSIA